MDTVLYLCLELWPDKERSDFSLERMQGGTFNRIIGITVVGAKLPSNGKPLDQITKVRKLIKAKRDTYYASRAQLTNVCSPLNLRP